jgi:CheY-like chemotaxis protein
MLTDLGMSGMNGWELASETRRRHPATRVVLVTGWGDAVTEAQARAHGVERVLGKPFTKAQVLACVEEVMRPLALAAAR